jgi:6-phosphogluconate dehydrogenase (decarboxylating)
MKHPNQATTYIYNIGSVENSWVLELLVDLGKEKVPVAEFRSRV